MHRLLGHGSYRRHHDERIAKIRVLLRSKNVGVLRDLDSSSGKKNTRETKSRNGDFNFVLLHFREKNCETSVSKNCGKKDTTSFFTRILDRAKLQNSFWKNQNHVSKDISLSHFIFARIHQSAITEHKIKIDLFQSPFS